MKWIMGTIAALTVCAGPAWADGPQRAPVGSPFADGPELSALSASDTPVVRGGPSRGTTTIDVYASSAPNAYGSPSWSGYMVRALYALENGLAVDGDRSTDPTGYEHAPAQVPGGEIAVTSFNSWRGVVAPPAPFASELGNRMHFGMHAYGDGINKFTLEDLTFELHSSDPWDSLGFVGDFIGYGYNGTSRYGIDWGADTAKGGGDDVVYTSGNGTTPVDEIVYVGVGNAWWPSGGANPQEDMDDYFAWLAAVGPINVTCSYSIGSDTGSDTVTVVPPVELEIYPSLVPDQTEPRVNIGDAPGTFEPDSWQNSATDKVNWHARYLADGDFLSSLFPAQAATLTVNDIESIRYSTKRPTGTTAGDDWSLYLYTRPIVGGDSSWYGYRFINNYEDHTETDAWTQYSTSSGMTFRRNSGTQSGHMDLATLKATYGSELVEMISVQTHTNFVGFDGYMDGLIVTLTDGTVGRVNFVSAASLTLEADDCQADTANGQLTVELWMRDVTQDVTGYYAEVDYDISKLSFNLGASSYTSTPFPLNITLMSGAEGPAGELQFDGNVGFGGPATNGDALLATLVFDIVGGDCTTTEITFDATPTFISELSYQGVGVATSLVNTSSLTLDGTPPTITCPADITQTADPGVCEAAVTVPAPTTGDNCGVASVVNDYNGTPDASDTYPVGTTTVTWTVTDDCGYTATCTHTVTVTDDEDPTITCPADISQTADPGMCDAAVTVPAPTTADNCGVASVLNDYNSTSDASDTYPVGTTTVTWTVTDIYGNSAICTHTVTVTDDEDPTITCPADISQTADPGMCDAAVTVPAPTTADNCGVASVLNDYNSTSDASDTYPVGTTTVTWTVTDIYGNSAICTHTVTVTDDEDPTITCPADVDVAADAGVCTAAAAGFSLGTPTTADNCGILSVTNDAPLTFPQGPTTVTWTVTDIHGNTNTCSQIVTVLAVNIVNVDITLVGIDLPTPPDTLERCIHFQTDDCGAYADVVLDFSTGSYVGPVEVPCGAWTLLCVKDEQHTLWDTATLTLNGAEYDATAVGLLAGDTDNDADVDINDVTLMMYQYGSPAAPGGCPWDGTRDSDFSDDGTVWTEDYVLMSGNWLTYTSCPCTAPRPGGGAIEQFGTIVEMDARTLPADVAAYVDANADGVIDFVDVQEFERVNGLPNDLSELIRATAEQQNGEMQKAGGRMQRP